MDLESIYNENISLIESRFPEVIDKLNKTDNNDINVFALPGEFPNLMLAKENGETVFFHSTENPVKESQKMTDGIDTSKNTEAFFVFGFGAGYHIEALIDKINKEIPIIIIEKSPIILREAFKLRVYKKIFSRRNILIVLDELPYDATFLALCNFYNISPRPGYQILTVKYMNYLYHKIYMILFKDYYDKVLKEINSIVESAGDNLQTFLEFIDLWGDNIITNINHYIFNPGVAELKDVFKDIPAIIVAAGPSLDRNINELKELRNKAVIFCVDTALKTLIAHDISPHFVLSIDGQEINSRHYEGYKQDNTYLICDTVSHPKILNMFTNKMFVASCGHPLNFYFEDLAGEKGFVPGSGSVATNTINLSLFCGSSPIVFMGLDLSYSDWQTHTKASGHLELMNNEISKFVMPANYIINNKTAAPEAVVKGNYTDTVHTTRVMARWLQWIEKLILEIKDRKFINATEGGAYIEGTEVMTLCEAAEEYFSKSYDDIYDRIKEIHNKKIEIDPGKILKGIKETVYKINDVKKISRKGINLLKEKQLNPKENRKMMINTDRYSKQITGNKIFMRISQWDVEPLISEMFESEAGMQEGVFNKDTYLKLFKGVYRIADKIINRLETAYERINENL